MQTHRILVIDNDQEAVEAVMDALEPEGFLVFSADKADEGIDKAKKIHPSLMFVNIVMPGQSGLHVCKELQSVPGLKKAPIIMLTIRDGAFDPRYTELFGILDVLKKPLDPDRILDIAHRHLKTGVDLKASDDSIPLEKDLDSLFTNLAATPDPPPAAPSKTPNSPADRPTPVIEPVVEPALAADMGSTDEGEAVAEAEELGESEPWAGVQEDAVEIVETGAEEETPDIFVPDIEEDDIAQDPEPTGFAFTAEHSGESDTDRFNIVAPSVPEAESPLFSDEEDISASGDPEPVFSVGTDDETGYADAPSSALFEDETPESHAESSYVLDEPSPGKRGSRLPLIAGIGVLLIAIAGGGAWYFFMRDTGPTPTRVRTVKEPIAEKAPFKPAEEATEEKAVVVETVTEAEQAPEPAAGAPLQKPESVTAKPAVAAKETPAAPSVPTKRAEPPSAAEKHAVLKGYGVQVGAFSKLSGAESLVRDFESRGFPAALMQKGNLHKVIVGPYPAWAEANAAKEKITRDKEFKGAYLVTLP